MVDDRISLTIDDIEICSLHDLHDLPPLESENKPRDVFLATRARPLELQHVTRTYLALWSGSLVGYVTVMADAVKLMDFERAGLGIDNEHPGVSAVKVAHLAVRKSHALKYRGTGTALMAFAAAHAMSVPDHVGCRLLVLDAEGEALAFYRKLGFVDNKERETKSEAKSLGTRSLRVDLWKIDGRPSWLPPAVSPG